MNILLLLHILYFNLSFSLSYLLILFIKLLINRHS